MTILRILAAIVSLVALPLSELGAASPPAARGRNGAVVSAEPTSTEIGLEVLRSGGNAVDAAVATALAMVVVHPQAGNLGGGGFAVVRFGDEVTSLDFRETAPAAARRDMYLDGDGHPVADASIIGPLAAGVPGSPAGLWELHRRFGVLPWRRVVEPAANLAAAGFRVTRRLAFDLERRRELLSRFPETAARWLPDGEVPGPGQTLRLPELAASLRAYADDGPSALTAGSRARAVVAASRRHGGILTLADLGGYRPRWLPALEFSAFGWRFASMDLPSSGGYLVGATLGILEKLDWGSRPRFGADRAHLLAESWRRVFADRVELGDRSSTRVAVAQLMHPERLARLAADIDPSRATASQLLRAEAEQRAAESSQTVHLSVIDAQGQTVALTTTLNGTFGCGLWVPHAGYFLNNEMDDFTTAPGRANLFGLVQGPANEVAAGRRMLSSMSPTIAWRDDAVIAIGGRGGSRIPTAVAQVLLNLLVDEDPLQAAVDRPRLHHQWLPDEISVEADALAPETRAVLEGRGHRVEPGKATAKVNVVRWLAPDRFEAAGDPRGPAAGGVVEPGP